MSRKHATALAVILFLLVASVAVSGCGSKSGPKYLRVSVGAEPETLDPRKSTGIPESTVQAQLFEGLTTLDEVLAATPPVD